MKKIIIVLHGWGTTLSGDRYHELKKLLEAKGHTVFTPDLPGFGKETLQKKVMVLDDYVSFVHAFMKKHTIKNAIIIGHSFGGRIGAKLAVKYPELVEKLILTGAPLIKRKLSLKKKIAYLAAKTGKRALSLFPEKLQQLSKKVLYRSIDEWDYYKAQELKETFKAIIGEDLSVVLPKISVPTTVIWGGNDTFVPLVDGEEIAKRIKNAKFVVVENATHRLPYEHPVLFFKALVPSIL